MARIRTIKPSFFRHETLFEAERSTGLPLRLAFAGLWTAADREGRFRWQPRVIKLDVLPFDEVDFSRVLDALTTRGFIVRYTVGAEEFGCIPSWPRHQTINNRESASTLPQPPESTGKPDPSPTRGPRVSDMHERALVEGEREQEGEGKGTDKERGGAGAPTKFAFIGQTVRLRPDDFMRWQTAYWAIPDFVAELTKADSYYTAKPPDDGNWFFKVSSWLDRSHNTALAAKRAAAEPKVMVGI